MASLVAMYRYLCLHIRLLCDDFFMVMNQLSKWNSDATPICAYTQSYSKYQTITHYVTIDPSHKSQNASVAYPTMQHFVTEMCTCVHISVTK